MVAQKKKQTELVVTPIQQKAIRVQIIGSSGLYLHSMASKAKRELLVGSTTRGRTRKDIKHHPFEEYKDCFHFRNPEGSPTLFGLPATMFKQALAGASVDTAGIAKTQTNRLVYVDGERVPLWGVPYLRIDVVRNSDINRTPDMRTRPYFPEWASELTIYYGTPMFTEKSILTLLVNAGIITGVGDNRQERGKDNYGQFRVVSTDEEMDKWQSIVDAGGYDLQIESYDSPDPYDEGTRDLLEFYQERLMEDDSTVKKTVKPQAVNGNSEARAASEAQ